MLLDGGHCGRCGVVDGGGCGGGRIAGAVAGGDVGAGYGVSVGVIVVVGGGDGRTRGSYYNRTIL